MCVASNWIHELIDQESLPEGFEDTVEEYFIPIAEQINTWHKMMEGKPIVVGINGAQGTGKSTLSLILAAALKNNFEKSTVVMSIDDMYHSKKYRQQLAADIHPLLATRGVPGTHDTELGINIINQLKGGVLPVQVPVFSKATDDQCSRDEWNSVNETTDVIIIEGWCVGASSQDKKALSSAINELERLEDSDGVWREYVNKQLEEKYQPLFSLIDKLVMLKAPDFDCIYEWRGLQESKLRSKLEKSAVADKSGVMDEIALKHFIMHYERLTRWMLHDIPQRADILIPLDHGHGVTDLIFQGKSL